VREKVIQYFEKRVLPHLKSVENDSVNQLDTMQKVINFSVLDLLDQDPRKHWDDIYELYQEDFSAATGRNDPTLCELGNRLDQFCRGFITIDAILSSCSFGVFFRMPSWLADFDYDIIQRSPSVQAELYALGYWSFDMIEGPETSLICGYNIGEPPPEAAEHADSKEKRDLVDDMSREYHSCAHVSQERQTKFASVGGARGIDDDVPLVHGDSANISEAPEDDQTLSRVLEGMTLSIVSDDEFRREAVQAAWEAGASMTHKHAEVAWKEQYSKPKVPNVVMRSCKPNVALQCSAWLLLLDALLSRRARAHTHTHTHSQPLMRFALASGGARGQGARGRRRQRAVHSSHVDGARANVDVDV